MIFVQSLHQKLVLKLFGDMNKEGVNLKRFLFTFRFSIFDEIDFDFVFCDKIVKTPFLNDKSEPAAKEHISS